jgi:hypothetical protein
VAQSVRQLAGFQPETEQWVLATLIAALSIFYFVFRWRAEWQAPFDPRPGPGYPTEAAFLTEIATLPVECNASKSFANRGKELYSSYLDSMKALDDKAASILGFVGGGTGLVALGAGTETILSKPTITPLLLLALLYLLGVLAAALAVQIPRNRGSVNVEQLCDVGRMKLPSAESQGDALMGREFIEASRAAVVVVRKKAMFLALAQLCFAFGVGTLVVNAFAGTTARPSAAQRHVHCMLSQAALDCILDEPKEKK